jgi:hypothetical protein
MSDNNAPVKRDYLVFESTPQHRTRPDGTVDYEVREVLHSYNCIGSVRAVDEMDAVRAVMAYTRRIGKYAVIPATFIDFAPTGADAPEAVRPQLNP